MRLRAAGTVVLVAVLAGSCGDDGEDVGRGGLAELVATTAPDFDDEGAADDDPADDDDPAADEDETAEDDAADGAAVETATVEVADPSLPPFGSSDDDAMGLQAPAVRGTATDGRPMSIVPGDGPMIVGFFAHWCPHCQAEVPVVVDWLADGGLPDGVELVAVSTAVNEARPNFPPSEWFEAEGWDVPTMADDESGSAHLAYGGGGFPYWVVLDADGAVVARRAGELPASALDDLAALAQS
jgi:cytochrome c biogenesis protein CcmG, thiol:disulfide interchange protein DsbE